jgi:hypothetical protein
MAEIYDTGRLSLEDGRAEKEATVAAVLRASGSFQQSVTLPNECETWSTRALSLPPAALPSPSPQQQNQAGGAGSRRVGGC